MGVWFGPRPLLCLGVWREERKNFSCRMSCGSCLQMVWPPPMSGKDTTLFTVISTSVRNSAFGAIQNQSEDDSFCKETRDKSCCDASPPLMSARLGTHGTCQHLYATCSLALPLNDFFHYSIYFLALWQIKFQKEGVIAEPIPQTAFSF